MSSVDYNRRKKNRNRVRYAILLIGLIVLGIHILYMAASDIVPDSKITETLRYVDIAREIAERVSQEVSLG